MKLAIATLAASLSLATAASAMIGPYERAVDDPATHAALFTTGEAGPASVAEGGSASPEAVWTNGEAASVTVVSTKGQAYPMDHFGASAR